MANYANLLAQIAANIYSNNNQDITGDGLQLQLNAMVASLGAGYQFMGVAHPADTPSGYADLRAFWLAGEAGTYTDFGGQVLNDGEVAVIKYDGNGWSKSVTGAASAERVNTIVKNNSIIFHLNRIDRPIYLEENTTTGEVFFRFSGTLYLRGAVSMSYTMQQLATELNTSLVTSTKGATNCIALPNVYNLVFDSNSLTMKIKNRSDLTINDIPLILTSTGTISFVNQGLLNANDPEISVSNDKLVDYFLLRSDRGRLYLEEDTTSGYVFVKYPGTLYLRGRYRKDYTIQQLASELGVSLVTSIQGETGCLAIPNVSSLVYDNIAGLMKIRGRDSRLVTDTILITSSSGTITYINQGLLNAFDAKKSSSATSAASIVDYYAAKTKEIENLAKNNDASFIFFSDIHAQSVNFRRIVQLANYLGASKVNAIINGGDTVSNVIGDGLTWYDDIVDLSNIDVLSCCGNHDVWSSSWQLASKSDVYNAVIAPVISKVQNIIQPSGAAANGDCYYYKDYGSIRVIVLCAMVESLYSQMFWDTAQSNWFENVLANARTNNKSVICVNHSPFAKTDAVLNMDTKWSSYLAKDWKNDTAHQLFDSIHTAESAVEKVSNFIAAGGKFICWLTGHLHIDSIQSNAGQVMFNIASANNNNHPDGYKTNSIDNYIYDCFNYLGIDTAHNFIKIYRIGWDMDASLRVRTLLNYDFVNKVLVTEN